MDRIYAKKSLLTSTMASRQLQNFLLAIPKVLSKLVNTCAILKFIFDVALNFGNLLLKHMDRIYAKKSLLASTMASRQLQNFLLAIPKVLSKLVNTCAILKFIFDVAWNFCNLLLKHSALLLIKGFEIWGVRQPDIQGNVATNILWQLKQDTSACVI